MSNIIQIMGTSEGVPTYALTESGQLLVWVVDYLPFGGKQYCFKALDKNVERLVTPAFGLTAKLMGTHRYLETSGNLKDLALAHAKKLYGTAIYVPFSSSDVKIEITEHVTTATVVLKVSEYPSVDNTHTGRFTGTVKVLNTVEKITGWWNEETKTIQVEKA